MEPPPPPPTVSQVESQVMQKKRTWRDRAGKAGAGVAVAAGAAKVAGAGKLFGLLKGVWLFAHFKTAFTMLLSVAGYALFYGWWFAIGFVLLIFVHEIGHVIVLRIQGVKASAPMFIPFLGAFVKVEGEQRSVAQEAASALAGPIAGTIGTIAVLAAAESSGSPLLTALAYSGFLINFFNLFPVLPLDGGRVAGALHPALWIAGLAGAAVMLILRPSPIWIFALILGGIETYRRWKDRKAGRTSAFFDVPTGTRWAIGGAYLAVALLCLYGMEYTYVPHHW
ncbi:MAG: site-2 protease family protein [Hamadaea sp.]|uniref:site-2 protease family protein n=1 Tax=Hamadaea sp. TaxID=2024425 RepID=UPI0017CF6281|nr:site-2 protease family protein [Hamadaea sp.]NUR73302.1 site-2 protease family protein [Hamadaea sp.]NUT21519.1 site-2 protease family protein [Hamadaea sp.]